MDSLPPSVRAVVSSLESRPPRTAPELRTELRAYLASFDSGEAAHHPFADAELARRIGAGCLALLADPAISTNPSHLRRAQLAIDYLILEDDAESDADSALGFDDDAQVFDAIARALNRADLCLEDPAS